MKIITREELRAALQSPKPPVLLEALPPSYFEVEHLPVLRACRSTMSSGSPRRCT